MPNPRSSRVTMAEVARRSGVSPMTVSYCYNQPDRVAPETLRRVRAVATELGYAGPDPTARSLRRRHNGAIGVVLGEHLAYAFEDPQARNFLTGVAEVCRERGTGLNLIPTTGAATDVERVRSAAVDGFIVWTTTDYDPVLDTVGRLGRPVAIHGGPFLPSIETISIHNRTSARELAAHTFRGSQHPAVLSFPFDRGQQTCLEIGPDPSLVQFPVTRERLQGIYDYCTGAGHDPRSLPVAVAAGNDRHAAITTAELLLDSLAVDAVIAMSDQLAFAVLDAARGRGLRIPEDIAVSGWDDDPDARREGLTTITQSLHGQGRACALIALGEPAPDHCTEWTVTVRTSTR
ncbi:LacI family DNA-binding transcriptional regulator [Nocardia brasiliensis]|uniref:LacI family DNA-binding transcriptional regulator n=1 Tax=Nocardia brasiliensis TaxID=37326 RepID=UPI002453FD81|nr:LacI family DNA-binding transcriptional regulator [Nocardia brasiliensis]